jgi:hypothetical protein
MSLEEFFSLRLEKILNFWVRAFIIFLIFYSVEF